MKSINQWIRRWYSGIETGRKNYFRYYIDDAIIDGINSMWFVIVPFGVFSSLCLVVFLQNEHYFRRNNEFPILFSLTGICLMINVMNEYYFLFIFLLVCICSSKSLFLDKLIIILFPLIWIYLCRPSANFRFSIFLTLYFRVTVIVIKFRSAKITKF